MKEKLCGICRFYEYVGPDNCDGLDSGLCRRYPPTCPPIDAGDDINSFPIVFANSWCGEWGAVLGRKLKNPSRRRLLCPS